MPTDRDFITGVAINAHKLMKLGGVDKAFKGGTTHLEPLFKSKAFTMEHAQLLETLHKTIVQELDNSRYFDGRNKVNLNDKENKPLDDGQIKKIAQSLLTKIREEQKKNPALMNPIQVPKAGSFLVITKPTSEEVAVGFNNLLALADKYSPKLDADERATMTPPKAG